MPEKIFTGADLEQALKNDALTRSEIKLVGMVKSSDREDHINFTTAGCENWIDLPTAMIEQAEHLGQSPCKDHAHPVVRLTLKEPKDPEARLLAALLAQSAPMPAQVGPGSVPQLFPVAQGGSAMGGSFPSAGSADFGTTSFLVPLPQASALVGNSGAFGGMGLGGLTSALGLNFSCTGYGCACQGDWDCNNMFSSGLCKGAYARCWVRSNGLNVFCICSR